MARDSRAAFERALAEVAPEIERAFIEAVRDIQGTAQMRAIERIIENYAIGAIPISRAIEGVQASMELGREYWAPLDDASRTAYRAGGDYQTGLVPRGSISAAEMRFDVHHPQSEEWMRRNSGRLITELQVHQRENIRGVLQRGVEENRGYRTISRDLIGRKEGRARKGGVLNLHPRQSRAVDTARRELESGDFNAFRRRSETTRGRQYNRLIARAQRDGRSLTADEVDKITKRYSDGLLQQRGQMIARTEGNKAMNMGRKHSIDRMISSGKMDKRHVKKTWVATIGKDTRDSHRSLNRQTKAWDEQFVSPVTGHRLDHPHDEDAPAEETVFCRCFLQTEIDYLAMAE